MKTGQLCNRNPTTVRKSDDLIRAAQLMREKHIGYLVVVEPDAADQSLRPVGVLTDRDIVVSVVARETGLRTGRRISHVFLMDVPTYHKVLVVTDAAINIAPGLEDKADICQNAIDLARDLGLEKPKVAILAAVETVN